MWKKKTKQNRVLLEEGINGFTQPVGLEPASIP